MNRDRNSKGFTLVELLVAMLIFISVMSGVAILFSNAINAVAQGHMNMDGYELARSTLARMERDVKAAFAARERGDVNQFYGRREGFTLVGVLDDGSIGRVTYVIRPRPVEETGFTTTHAESLGLLLRRAFAYGMERGIGVTVASDLSAYLLDEGQIDNTTYLNCVDYVTAADALIQDGDDPSLPSLLLDPITVELEVLVQTASLLRYAEPGYADLDTFPLPPPLTWPYVDPANPGNDDYAGTGDFGDQREFLFNHMVQPIAPGSYDMRELIEAFNNPGYREDFEGRIIRNASDYDLAFTEMATLKVLNPGAVDSLVDAKRRELWIRILADDSALVNADGLDSIWQQYSPDDFVLADNILYGGTLYRTEGASNYTNPKALRGFDVFGRPGYFSYGDGSQYVGGAVNSSFTDTFNAPENVPGYWRFYNGVNSAANPLFEIHDFDFEIAQSLGSKWDSGTGAGSPLDPRMPYTVEVGFWIVIERKAVQIGDFRRWFSESIDVPSGFTRWGGRRGRMLAAIGFDARPGGRMRRPRPGIKYRGSDGSPPMQGQGRVLERPRGLSPAGREAAP